MRRSTLLLAAALIVSISCSSGQGCGGCASLQPLPGGRYAGVKVDNAMNARLTASGYAVLNSNWYALLSRFTGGTTLQVPLPCTIQNVSLLGNVAIADEGATGCTSEACGQLDGKCDARDVPRTIPIVIQGLTLAPAAPDKIVATLDVDIATGKIMVDTVSRNHIACAFQSAVKCAVDFDTGRVAPGTTHLSANIQLEIDTRWDRLLSFKIASIGGAASCTSSQSPPSCIDPADLLIEAVGSCQTCDAGGWEFVKSFIVNQLASSLSKSLQDAVDRQACELCEVGGACPQLPSAMSTCQPKPSWGADAGYCADTTTARCVPRLLGVEGRLPVDALLGSFGAPQGAAIDLSVAAGGSASSDTGTNLAVRGGASPVEVADCVRPLPLPAPDPISPPDFDAEAPGPYDLALSASSQLFDLAAFQAHQAGALCLQLTSQTVAQLSSATVGTLLPSLTKLTGGEDVPMMVVLRPNEPPKVRVGNAATDALLTVSVKDLAIDVYARLDERQVRLFTVTADVQLPLNLTIEQCRTVTPVIKSLEGAVTNVRASNSEILAEDLPTLEQLVPLVLTFAEPQLAKGLAGFTLPDLADFQVNLKAVAGAGALSGGGFQHLAVYTALEPLGTTCASLAPEVTADPLSHFVEGPAFAPVAAQIQVSAQGAAAHYSWRVNKGLWSAFAAPPVGDVLRISHPALQWPGKHLVEIRARTADGASAISAPVPVELVRDIAAPTVKIARAPGQEELLLAAHDDATEAEALAWAIRLGEGPWSSFGEKPTVTLDAAEAAGFVGVRVRDQSGKQAEATWRAPRVAERPDLASAAGSVATGCSTTGAGASVALLALVSALAARRRRNPHR